MKYGAQLARIFTTSFAREVISGNESGYLKEMQVAFPFIKQVLSNNDYKLLFKNAFLLLAEDYRNEYVYKTVFYSKVLEEQERCNKLNVTTELRSGNSITDIASFGSKRTSNSIEIKSDIDNVLKAKDQVLDYQKMFPLVSLISSKKQIDHIYKEIPSDIGLIALNSDLSISVLKKPKYNDSFLDKNTMFYTLRRYEYEMLVLDYYKFVPDVPNGLIFEECYKLAMNIPVTDFYKIFRKRLSERIHAEDTDGLGIPDYLTFMARKSSLTKKEKTKFIEKVIVN